METNDIITILPRKTVEAASDILLVSACTKPPNIEPLKTLVLGSSSSVKIPTPWEDDKKNTQYLVSCNTCDGVVCLYHPEKSGFVVNPTTRWYRPLPLCGLQQLIIDLDENYNELTHAIIVFKLGFGKDIFTGTYKAVWLYNSLEIGLENSTTCEIFDFNTNTWRYVTPASPYRVVGVTDSVLVDGSLHWFIECEETKLISFDLHTETFQVICKALFAKFDSFEIDICNLDNRLCVSKRKWPNQVIWSFNSDNKTWDKMCSIDLELTSLCYDISTLCALHPIALLDGEKNYKTKKKKETKLLFYGHKEKSNTVDT